MHLFYHPEVLESDQQVIFSKEESRHIVKVLRKKEGDLLQLTNGKGYLFKIEILTAGTNKCIAEIKSFQKKAPAPYHLHLAVAPTKMNDRYEWFLEKSTEIGVQEITPLICDHSERKVLKTERFERVLQSAVKQSLHTYFPKLNDPLAFSDFLELHPRGQRYIAHCEDQAEKSSLKSRLQLNEPVVIMIGPEGDFSSEEISKALAAGWQPVSLGDSRLRTETAGMVACHTVALAHEN